MKILFLSPVVWHFYKLQNQALPEVLAQKGYKCVYVNPVKYKGWQHNNRFANLCINEPHENIRIVERTSRIRRSLWTLFYENYNNVCQIRKNKPSVVVSYDHLMSLLPCIYCLFAKIPFIFNVSDDWDNVPQKKTAQIFWKYIAKPIIARFSHTILSTSHKQKQLFSKKNKHTYLLPNGKENLFIESFSNKQNALQPNTINFIANLRPWYDFDLLFDVFEELPELHLNIYGSGELYNYLKDKAASHKNIDIKGNIRYSDTPSVLAASLCGIIPLKLNTLNDSTCPIKLFDYWAARKAVIATPTCELINIGNDCLMFASDKVTFIKHLRFLIENPQRRNFLGDTGFEKIESTYNYTKISELFLDILKKRFIFP